LPHSYCLYFPSIHPQQTIFDWWDAYSMPMKGVSWSWLLRSEVARRPLLLLLINWCNFGTGPQIWKVRTGPCILAWQSKW
jgi:hypothetical protein